MARLTRQELADKVQNENLRVLMENPAFVKFIWTICVDAHIFFPTYSHRSAHETSYQEGRRAVGLEVLHRLRNALPGVPVLSLIERAGNLLEAEIKAAITPTHEDDDEPLPLPDDEYEPDSSVDVHGQ